MSIYTAKSIKCGEPELKEILKKHKNMSELKKKVLKAAILKNLYIPKKKNEQEE